MRRAVEQRIDGWEDGLWKVCHAQPLQGVNIHEQRQELKHFRCGVEPAYGHSLDRWQCGVARELQVAGSG